VFCANGTITVSPSGDRWRLDAARASSVQLPMSVEEAIQARISALTAEERELMERGATLGSLFWLGALVVMGRLEGDAAGAEKGLRVGEGAQVEAVLDELGDRDYLLKMPDSTVPGELEYAFKHNLEHDLVARMVTAERAKRYHRAAAEWLETKLPSKGEQ